MKKRIIALLLTFVMAAGMLNLLPGSVAAAPAETGVVVYTESGRTSVPKLTLSQLRTLYSSITPSGKTLYQTSPVITSGYRVGVLTSAAYDSAKDTINYYRRAAGLAPVEFTQTANESAAWGALTLAMSGVLDHNPPKPAAMKDADYAKGVYATSHSNLSRYVGTADKVLSSAIAGQMKDSSSAANVASLGHRRWLLNPSATNMGIGVAHNGSSYYTDVAVFGDYVATEYVTDYQFISWPASGFNLSNTFPVSTPWSISLNPERFQAPDRSKIVITLTRATDGKKWTFNSSTGTTVDSTKDYFNVDTRGYGVRNCIIFYPAYSNLKDYSGDYDVLVTGLNTRDGSSAQLHYTVRFADVKEGCGHDTTSIQNAKEATCVAEGYSGDQVCSKCGIILIRGTKIEPLGHDLGQGTVILEPEHLTPGQMEYQCRRCGETVTEAIPVTCISREYTDVRNAWYHEAVDYVIENQIMVGIGTGAFGIGKNMTRAEGAQLFYNMAGQPTVRGTIPFADVRSGRWYTRAAVWAYQQGIVKGDDQHCFRPDGLLTREQMIVVLYRWNGAGSADLSALDRFPDRDAVAFWAQDAMAWAVENELIRGTGAGELAPQGNLTREMTAALIFRYLEKFPVIL